MFSNTNAPLHKSDIPVIVDNEYKHLPTISYKIHTESHYQHISMHSSNKFSQWEGQYEYNYKLTQETMKIMHVFSLKVKSEKIVKTGAKMSQIHKHKKPTALFTEVLCRTDSQCCMVSFQL